VPVPFHLDEHISGALAIALRHRGIDVTTTAEAGLVGAADQLPDSAPLALRPPRRALDVRDDQVVVSGGSSSAERVCTSGLESDVRARLLARRPSMLVR
jgi:hypothetical protein